MYSKVTLKVFFYHKYNGMITLLRKFGKFIQKWWQILCLTQAACACFPPSPCLPCLLICAGDGLVAWFLFWNNYQNFCSPSCKSLRQGGRSYRCITLKQGCSPCSSVPLQGSEAPCPHHREMFNSIVCAAWPGTSEHGMGQKWGRGVFQVKVSQRLYLSTARKRTEQSFILHFFCNLLLPSFAAS